MSWYSKRSSRWWQEGESEWREKGARDSKYPKDSKDSKDSNWNAETWSRGKARDWARNKGDWKGSERSEWWSKEGEWREGEWSRDKADWKGEKSEMEGGQVAKTESKVELPPTPAASLEDALADVERLLGENLGSTRKLLEESHNSSKESVHLATRALELLTRQTAEPRRKAVDMRFLGDVFSHQVHEIARLR